MHAPIKKYRFKKIEKKTINKAKINLFCKEKLSDEEFEKFSEKNLKGEDFGEKSLDAFIEESRARGLNRPATPVSSYTIVDSVRTIRFNGYKLPDDQVFYCLNCFESTHGIYISSDNESTFLLVGERPYIDPNTYRKYQPRIDDLCSKCWATLLTVKDKYTQCAFGEEEDQSE